jgi:cysteine desulfurase
MRRLYFDWNASAPLRPEAAEAMARAAELAGNPSSTHAEGRAARDRVEDARARVSQALDAAGARVVFTSGATESDNLALLGFAAAAEGAGLPRKLVATAIEHSAVLEPARHLESRGWSLTLVNPDKDGRVDPAGVDAAAEGASLVSWMLANNDVGTIQPVESLPKRQGRVLHTDAAQVPGRLPLSFRALGCDLLTLSGHKFGGPKGSGVLVVRGESLLAPLSRGGGHEFGLRAGTENVAAAAGFAAALEAAVASREREAAHVKSLTDSLRSRIAARIPDAVFATPAEGALVNTTCVLFPGVDGRDLVVALDLAGVAASVGSACASGSNQPSHVLVAMGFPVKLARAALRLSLGAAHAAADVDELVDRLERVWRRVRSNAS